jgi:hypothetical protein
LLRLTFTSAQLFSSPTFLNIFYNSDHVLKISYLHANPTMGSGLPKLGIAVVLFGILYQTWLKETLFETIGIFRVIQSIDEFPYTCRRIYHERLEACEDLWLDDQERVLYLACAGSLGRLNWNPA